MITLTEVKINNLKNQKMKEIFRNVTLKGERMHDCSVLNINGKFVKITYECYNAVERCNVELFDGDKWNHIFSMLDSGTMPDTSVYSSDDELKKRRANALVEIAKFDIKKLLSHD